MDFFGLICRFSKDVLLFYVYKVQCLIDFGTVVDYVVISALSKIYIIMM